MAKLLVPPYSHMSCKRTHSVSLNNKNTRRKRIYLLDVLPICYNGSKRSPSAFRYWIKLLLSSVTKDDPIIAVFDGERGIEYRQSILPSYKSGRKKFSPLVSALSDSNKVVDIRHRDVVPFIEDFLCKCNIPVVKVEDAEADDVVATLTSQLHEKGFDGVIASPDKDFKQLITERIQLVLPMPDLKRWSFFTSKHYITQNDCEPSADLSLLYSINKCICLHEMLGHINLLMLTGCMIGDECDCVPGLPQVAPGFGRKTAIKLLKKHGSLENILEAASIRTVGKPYIQDALIKHAELLRRNLRVLKLRRDVDVILKDEWCQPRITCDDVAALSRLNESLEKL